MCHRQLKFVKHSACGHNTFLDAALVDCGSRECIISTAHPPSCNSPSKPCLCRRYYGQPERIITKTIHGKCSNCPQ